MVCRFSYNVNRVFFMEYQDFLVLLQQLTDQPVIFALLIIFMTFVIEDLATTGSALIASQTDVHYILPLTALFVGIVIGDVALFFIGKYASKTKLIQKFLCDKKVQKAQELLDKNLIIAIFGSRFLPGMRFPTYVAIGALGTSFSRFITIVLIAVGIWTGVLFYLFYTLGQSAENIMGALKWVFLGALVLAFVVVPKALTYFLQKKAQ